MHYNGFAIGRRPDGGSHEWMAGLSKEAGTPTEAEIPITIYFFQYLE